jgi:hypothetical protein
LGWSIEEVNNIRERTEWKTSQSRWDRHNSMHKAEFRHQLARWINGHIFFPKLLLRKIGTLRFLLYILHCKFAYRQHLGLYWDFHNTSMCHYGCLPSYLVQTTPHPHRFVQYWTCVSKNLHHSLYCSFTQHHFRVIFCTKLFTTYFSVKHTVQKYYKWTSFFNWMNSTTAMKTSQVHFSITDNTKRVAFCVSMNNEPCKLILISFEP